MQSKLDRGIWWGQNTIARRFPFYFLWPFLKGQHLTLTLTTEYCSEVIHSAIAFSCFRIFISLIYPFFWVLWLNSKKVQSELSTCQPFLNISFTSRRYWESLTTERIPFCSYTVSFVFGLTGWNEHRFLMLHIHPHLIQWSFCWIFCTNLTMPLLFHPFCSCTPCCCLPNDRTLRG